MRIEFFPFPLLVGIAIICLLMPIRWQKKHNWLDLFCFVMFALYLLAVINLTLFPIPIGVSENLRTPYSNLLAWVNLTPFRFGNLFDFPPIYAIYELGGNILLTVPFGFAVPILMRTKLHQTAWLALSVGLTIELAQLSVCLIIGGNYRSVDINDVLLNAIGVLLGYGLFHGLTRLYRMAIPLFLF